MTQSGITWQKRPSEAFPELATAYVSAIHAGVVAIMQAYAPEVENWMRDNAPWTDRTGNARQGLYTALEELVNETVTLILSHGVTYGKYLELCNAGRYAIIAPALDVFAPRIWADVQRMLS